MSEYIEGWSNNKAIEIYNPTDAAIDLSDYRLERYSNGATAAQDNQKVDLSGTSLRTAWWWWSWTSKTSMGWTSKRPCGMSLQRPPICGFALCMRRTTRYQWQRRHGVAQNLDQHPIDIFGKIGEDPEPRAGRNDPKPHLDSQAEVTGGDTDA